MAQHPPARARTGDAICNLAWLYVANGSSVAEIDLATGYRNWQTPIDQLQSFTLLDSGTGIALAGDDAIGIDLWAGEVIWQRRVDDIGALAGGPAWLRTSGGELFKLLPWSGERWLRSTRSPASDRRHPRRGR